MTFSFIYFDDIVLLVTLGQSKDCYESPSGSFNCPRLFDSGGKPLSPLPPPLYIKEKTNFQAANQSVRRHGQRDRQTDTQTNSAH
jgi:hypothetical protein